ncbi:hypothetical protein ABLE91_04965 [Aquabacter sp. CN5-332]|uniref:hypothetical protein n=1 Tax=Aquabacter sp. CN5-332 TaxID=3156608 RepID=UPI0032B3782E
MVGRLWLWVLDLGYVAWILRAPLSSVVLGFLLMWKVPQAQDTLVDVAMAEAILPSAPVSWRMLALFASTFFLWAMPVHYSARLLLETDARYFRASTFRATRGPVTKAWVEGLRVYFPRILGAATFLPFSIGALYAIRDLPNLGSGGEDVAAAVRLWSLAMIMVAGVPIFLVYAMARRRLADSAGGKNIDTILDPWVAPLFRALGFRATMDNQAEMRSTGRLGLLVYVLLVGVVLIMTPLRLATLLPLALAIPLVLGGWVPVLSVIGYYGRRLRMPLILLFVLLPGILVYFWGDNHVVRPWKAEAGQPPLQSQRPTLPQALDAWMDANQCRQDPGTCPRPIIVAAAGGASRAAFFTASVIGHFLDVEQHRPFFSQARGDKPPVVKTQNDDGRIVKLAGTAPDAPALTAADVANRLFAISGVSGGAYGAVVAATALAERGPSGKLPCRGGAPSEWYGYEISNARDCLEALTSGDYLTPVFFGLAFHDQAQAWDPYQLLFTDDRASLLEQAWEYRFRNVITGSGGNEPAETGLKRPFFASNLRASQWVPLLILNGTSVATGQRIITSDLAATYDLNAPCPDGSQPGTCRVFKQAIDYEALITSRVAATATGRALMSKALKGTAEQSTGSEPATPRRNVADIALSTAATNSARFPIISPPGSIRDLDGNIVDRIVDGGYFENFGVLSALELAKAIVALQPRLAPFVLIIANDPQSTFLERRDAKSPVQTADVQDAPFFTEVTAPLGGVANVRTARGRLAVAELQTWARTHYPPISIPDPMPPDRFTDMPCSQHVAHIDVWPQVSRSLPERLFDDLPARNVCDLLQAPSKAQDVRLREVSMSWWLSKAVQINLHKQLESTQDTCNNDAAVAMVWNALQTRSQSCYPPQSVSALPRQTP